MIRYDAEWQRDFPHYEFSDRDIVLAEYESASERVRGDEQAIAISNGVLIAAIAPVIPTIGTFLGSLFLPGTSISEAAVNLALIALVLWFATAVLTRYLCQLRRSLVHSERKLIVLRRMLGLSYGGTTLVLPNWRPEGADNPFAIKLFPGWSLRTSYAFIAAAFLSAASMFAAVQAALPALQIVGPVNGANRLMVTATSAGIAFAWGALILWRVRVELMDLHESSALSVANILATMLGLTLERGTQTILYKARLARHEAKRLELNFNDMKRIAIFREDRRFREHRGVSYRSIVRAAYQRAQGKLAGGGSTIAQQLGRTLFVLDRHKTFRRKLVEIPLAYWLTKILTPDELLEVYLCSVRYDAHVNGVLAALRHFFGAGPDGLTLARSAVLIERISNIRRKFRGPSVVLYLKGLLKEKLISLETLPQIGQAYKDMIALGKLDATIEQVDLAISSVSSGGRM